MMTGEANDFSICTTWRMSRSDYYLMDVFRARLGYPDLRHMIASLAARHGAEVSVCGGRPNYFTSCKYATPFSTIQAALSLFT